MAATVSGSGGGSLGQDLAGAVTSAFFSWFHLIEYEPAKAIGGGQTWHGYRPSGSRYQDAVTLNLETDTGGIIDRLTLCLDRSFLQRPADCPSMRDIAKSFLTWSLPTEDATAVADLIEEIGDVTRCGVPILRHANMPQPDVPRFPSAGHRVFLGHEGAFDRELAASHLRIVNLNWSRRQDEVVTPPGYDGETMWMWLIVRRRS